LTRTAQSSSDIPTAVATERISPHNEEIKPAVSQAKTTTSMLQTYKCEAQERIKELNDKLQQHEHKLKETRDKFTAYQKFEQVQLELDVIKGEIQLNGSNQVENDIQQNIDNEQTIKMEQALIKLRDLSLIKQAENNTLKNVQISDFNPRVMCTSKSE
ncbi:unnamed protein product, partial [Rotaria sp. Silwood1]